MSESSEPSRRAPRASQREVKSCGFCYRRKLKCDKTYPCSRCVSRGLGDLCEQETVIVNGRLVGGGSERSNRRQPTMAQVLDENKSLHRKVSAQEKAIRSLLEQLDGSTASDALDRFKRDELQFQNSAGPSSRASSPELVARTGGEGKEGYLVTAETQLYGLSKDEAAGGQQPSHLFTEPSTVTLDSLRMLVPTSVSSALVRHHCNFLHWIHGVFHQPTFLAQHDTWIEALRRQERTDATYDFYALYFAVIASSLYFMDTQLALEMGLQTDAIETLPRFWFDTSLNCLQLAGFMRYPTIPILQAICVLPIIAHAFDSKYLSSLMHCGLGLARDLNFHLVQANSPSAVWGGNIKAQIVRRIWCCLMIADSLTPGAQHPYHLMFPPAWTSPPANVNDDEISDDRPIIPRPLDQVTCVSHILVMSKLADLFREFTPAFTSKPTANSRFRVVREFNDRFDHLFDCCPELRPRSDEVYSGHHPRSGPYDWRAWSRYVWATGLPALRIQLWRWHLGRSYSDPRFTEARHVCLAAARDMMLIRRKAVPIMFQKNWHVSSHTVICGMVLASELLQGHNDPATRILLHGEIQEVLVVLRTTSNPNAIVQRGLKILERMVADAVTTPSADTDRGAQMNLSEYNAETFTLGAGAGFVWPAPVGDTSDNMQLDLLDILLSSDAWTVPRLELGQ